MDHTNFDLTLNRNVTVSLYLSLNLSIGILFKSVVPLQKCSSYIGSYPYQVIVSLVMITIELSKATSLRQK